MTGSAPTEPPAALRLPGFSIARVRLVSGCTLFAYLVLHLGNHIIGLFGLDLMNEVGRYVARFIRSWPMTWVLYGALAAHLAASLWQIFDRRSLRMSAREWTQWAFGLAIPPLMVTHVMGTRYANEFYGVRDSYDYVTLVTFVFSPVNGWMNAAGLIAAWVHGCIGIHMWFRLHGWYNDRVRTLLAMLATLWPGLALAGYLSAGREVTALSVVGEWMEEYFATLNVSDDAVWGLIARDTDIALALLVGLFLAVVLARFGRDLAASRGALVEVDYLEGPRVRQQPGQTLLDISKASGVPHASVCGGKGRCSTCRVRIVETTQALKAPSEAERRVLNRLGESENVRLACQIVPTGRLRILRLLPADTAVRNPADSRAYATGEERVAAILFADIRGFTRTSESRLPFDVVYLINQYAREMGTAIEEAGGHLDKFMGDGVMAIFGLQGTPGEAAQAALAAAARMAEGLNRLNERLRGDLDEPLRIGVGIHVGPVVVGDMGYGRARGLTAIGDAVNTASRLEAETKNQKAFACVSAQTLLEAGLEVLPEQLRRVTVRGRREKLDVVALDALTLGQLVASRVEKAASGAEA